MRGDIHIRYTLNMREYMTLDRLENLINLFDRKRMEKLIRYLADSRFYNEAKGLIMRNGFTFNEKYTRG